MGVSHVQEFLDARPELDVSLHYVWLPMFPRVAEQRALPKMVERFADPATAQYWDDTRALGKDVKRRILPDFSGDVVWDAFILFDAAATWADAGEHVLGSGFTVEAQKERLFALLAQHAPARQEYPDDSQ